MVRLPTAVGLLLAAALLSGASAGAAARAFPFTRDSAVLPVGEKEPQVHLTEHLFRSTLEPYTRTGLRLLLGLGVAERLETHFGLDTDIAAWATDSTRVDARLASEWHYSPLAATEVLGLSFVGGLFLGLDAVDVEARVIVDKQLGRTLLAANVALRRTASWGKATVADGVDQRLEQTLAASFRVSDSFSAGVEGLAREAFAGAAYRGTAFFVGPTFTWVRPRWWLSLGLVAQVAADKPKADRGNGEPLEIRANERFLVRAVFGARD